MNDSELKKYLEQLTKLELIELYINDFKAKTKNQETLKEIITELNEYCKVITHDYINLLLDFYK